MTLSDNARGSLWMGIAMGAFTLNDTCMKAVTETMPLYQAMFLRGVLTTILIAAIGIRAGTLRFDWAPSDRFWMALRTVGEVGGTLAFLTALRHMPLANLSAILQSLPLAVTLAAAFFLGESIGWRRLSAILVGFAGVLLIVRPGTEGFDRWSLLGLSSVACVVLRDLATRRMSSALPSVTIAVAAALSVTLTGAALLPVSGWEAVGAPRAGLIATAAAFLIVGYLLIVMAMRTGEIGIVAPFRYTSLLFAIVLGWAVFHQLPDTMTIFGAAIVIATGVYTFHRERQRARSAAFTTPRA